MYIHTPTVRVYIATCTRTSYSSNYGKHYSSVEYTFKRLLGYERNDGINLAVSQTQKKTDSDSRQLKLTDPRTISLVAVP